MTDLRGSACGVLLIACALLAACRVPPSASSTAPAADRQALAEAGKRVFFDTRLSADGSTSCASCHLPEKHFTDGRERSVGAFARSGTRNAPSLHGLGDLETFFWDGREQDATQALTAAFQTPSEMGHASIEPVLEALGALPDYQSLFPTPPDRRTLAAALQAYLRSVPTTPTPFERALQGNDLSLMGDAARRGHALFTGKAQCAACHRTEGARPALQDGRFHHASIGFERIAGKVHALQQARASLLAASGSLGELVISNAEIAELGRFAVTSAPADLAAFRTPSLRNVAHTAPYMHDGSIPTLEAAVEHELYYRGLATGRPITLTLQEQSDLVDFLHALGNPPANLAVTPPVAPPGPRPPPANTSAALPR